MNHKVLLVLIVFSNILFISCSSHNVNEGEKYLPVTKIVDGDTFWAENGTEKGVKVRLIGVDAPESRKTGKKDVGYFGQEAKDYLASLLAGQSVMLVSDVDSLDHYGRTLAYVYLENGMFVNAELVKNGYAMVMTVPPNVRYADLFLELQREARINNRGLWAEHDL